MLTHSPQPRLLRCSRAHPGRMDAVRWPERGGSRHRPLPPDTRFQVRQIRLFITELGRERPVSDRHGPVTGRWDPSSGLRCSYLRHGIIVCCHGIGGQVRLQRRHFGRLGVQFLLQAECLPDPATVARQPLRGLRRATAVVGQLRLKPVELILEPRDQPKCRQVTLQPDLLLEPVPLQPRLQPVVLLAQRLARRLDLEAANRP